MAPQELARLYGVTIVLSLLGSIIISSNLALAQTKTAVCNVLQEYLLNPCSAYIKPDGSITSEGKRVKECFKSGVLFGGGSQTLSNFLVPRSAIEQALKIAAKLSGCDGIFNLVKLKEATDILNILKSFGKR